MARSGLLLPLLLSVVTAAPAGLIICNTTQPDLTGCLRTSINSALRTMQNGSEQLGLRPIDPFYVALLELKLGAGNVSVESVFRDVVFTGLSNTEVRTVRANVEEKKLEVTSKVPHLDVSGKFHMEGGLLSFPIFAEGNFRVNTTDVVAVLIVYYKAAGGNMALESLSLDLIPSNISYDFGKFLDGDNKLGEAMNLFLNENSHEVFTAMKPHVMRMLGDVVSDVIDRALRKLPVSVMPQ